MIKRILPRTLFGRALIIIVAPLILVQMIAAFVFYDRVWETVTRRLTTALAGDVAQIIAVMALDPSPAHQDWAIQSAYANFGITATVAKDERLADTEPPKGQGLLERRLIGALSERVRRPFALDVWSHPKEVMIDVQLDDGVLKIRAPRDRLFTTNVYVFLIWMIGSGILLFAVASLFMRNQVRPLRRLAEVADAFGKGREVPDFKPTGATEIRQVSSAFIQMRERIRRHLTQRTEMLAGVSHDLRTPLTRMKLELAMLGESSAIAGLRTDVSEMERMVDSYLAFARGEALEPVETGDVAALLADLVAGARRSGHAVTLDCEGDLKLPLRPQAFRRCLSNLLGNAIRHASLVEVHATRRDRSAEIVFDDDGPGIPPERREDAFKPFFRLERSRNPATGGVGLGLTIARDVVRAHGGDISLAESPLGGLRARIVIPV